MNYTLHQLKVFLEVVEKKSITKASESLFLTQPAVSIQLKKFQDQFPFPLIEIIGKKLFVTTFGEEIADASRKILSEVNKIDYRVSEFQGKLAGKLSFSVVSTGKYVMPFYLTDFIHEHSGIDFSIDVTNKQEVVSHLENNEVDFALVSVLPERLSIDKIPLLKNSLYLVGGKNESSDLSEVLEKGTFLYREKGSATRKAMEEFMQKEEIKVAKKIQLTSNEALKQAIIAGLGYSIMPVIGLQGVIDKGDVQVIPHKSLPIDSQWYIVWLKEKKLSPVAQAFLTHLEKEKDAITKKYFNWIDDY